MLDGGQKKTKNNTLCTLLGPLPNDKSIKKNTKGTIGEHGCLTVELQCTTGAVFPNID